MTTWRDTTERDHIPDEDDDCRAVGCPAAPIWLLESYSKRTGMTYSDVVCGRHLLGYLIDFGISGVYGASATITRLPKRQPPV